MAETYLDDLDRSDDLDDEFSDLDEAEPDEESGQDESEDKDKDREPPEDAQDFVTATYLEAKAEGELEKKSRRLEQEKARLAKLEARSLHVSPEEAKERNRLQESVKRVQGEVDYLERSRWAWPLDDAGVEARLAESDGAVVVARQVEREAMANLDRINRRGTYTGDPEKREALRAVEAAREVHLDALGNMLNVREVIETREFHANLTAFDAKREALKAGPPSIEVPTIGRPDIETLEPMVPRERPLSEDEGGA
jgi:hypothetical protein